MMPQISSLSRALKASTRPMRDCPVSGPSWANDSKKSLRNLAFPPDPLNSLRDNRVSMCSSRTDRPAVRPSSRVPMSTGIFSKLSNRSAIPPSFPKSQKPMSSINFRRPSEAPLANSVIPSPASLRASLMRGPMSARVCMESVIFDTASENTHAAPATTRSPPPMAASPSPKAVSPAPPKCPIVARRAKAATALAATAAALPRDSH